MKFLLTTLASLISGVSAASILKGERIQQQDGRVRPRRDVVTSNYMQMKSGVIPHPDVEGINHRHLLRRQGAAAAAARNISAGLTNVHDIYYIVDLVVGNQTIPVSVDTGSSDTWVVQQPYQCVSYWYPYPGAKPDCGLGDGFFGNLSGGIIPDQRFGRAYVDGTFVQGYFGYEEVTIGGITAEHQQIAIVNYTYWYGDGKTSGLLGLAYPLMTSLDGNAEASQAYDPVFFTMWKNKKISPIFSIALSRHENQTGLPPAAGSPGIPDTPDDETSFLALGGLPPVDYDDESWAHTPILGMKALTEWDFTTEERGFYLMFADAYVYGNSEDVSAGGAKDNSYKTTATVEEVDADKGLDRNTTQFPVLIDAGSTLSILPKTLVNKLYAAFNPPAKYLSSTGLFYAPCNATIPKFGVQIGPKQVFYFAPEDLLRQTARDPTGEYCRVGITDSDSGPHVLGVTFLTNVVAVFDVGENELRFASRRKY